MNTFKILAETLADKNFFDVKEVEEIIEVYFKLWLSDIRNEELITDDITKQRNRILSEKEQLDIQRSIIEKKLFDAKERLSEGKEVDKYWMSRANLAFRIIKGKIVRCQNQLTNLATVEKKRNIETSNTRERNIKRKVFEIVKERFGEEYAKSLFDEAETLMVANGS